MYQLIVSAAAEGALEYARTQVHLRLQHQINEAANSQPWRIVQLSTAMDGLRIVVFAVIEITIMEPIA